MTGEIIMDTQTLSRRAFGTVSLGVGFAAAAGPVAASVITTDTTGIEAGMVEVPTADGKTMPAYRARPKGTANPPVILVVQEIFGLHEWIRDIARRFAKEGWYAIAGAHYFRHGDPAGYTEIRKLFNELVMKVPDSEVMSDLDAEVKFAAGEKANTAKLGVTGFCWGGRITWLYAAHNPNLKAGVAWYGRLVGEPAPLQPKHPVDVAAQIKAPVLGLYGAKDSGIPLETVEKMRGALKAAGNTTSRIDVFENADHGFLADYRPSYNETDAKEAWRRALAWLRNHGAA
jgi:carboxymethylenebutenolidase